MFPLIKLNDSIAQSYDIIFTLYYATLTQILHVTRHIIIYKTTLIQYSFWVVMDDVIHLIENKLVILVQTVALKLLAAGSFIGF